MNTFDIEPPAPTIARAEAGNCGDSDGSDMDTFGTVEYPTPPVPPIEIRTRPFFPSDLIRAVAAAPTPPPPDIVTTGATVYPAPEFVITISSIEVTLFLVVKIPTAVAFVPPLGAVVKPIVGVLVNPEPSFIRDIVLTNPVPIVAVAVAIDPPLNI